MEVHKHSYNYLLLSTSGSGSLQHSYHAGAHDCTYQAEIQPFANRLSSLFQLKVSGVYSNMRRCAAQMAAL